MQVREDLSGSRASKVCGQWGPGSEPGRRSARLVKGRGESHSAAAPAPAARGREVMPATAGERRESQEDQEGRTRVQGTLKKQKAWI